MNQAQRLLKNAGFLMGSQVVTLVLNFFVYTYTAIYLGAEGFGLLSFAIAFTGIFSFLMDIGLTSLIVRDAARDRSLIKKYVENFFAIKIVLAIVTFLLICIFANNLNYPDLTIKLIYLFAFYTIFTSFNAFIYAIFQTNEKMEYQSLGQILNSLLMFLLIFYAIYNHLDIIAFAYIYLIVSIITFIYSLLICYLKFITPGISIDLSFWRVSLTEAIPFGIGAILATIYFSIDSILLSFIQGNTAVGFYTASYRLTTYLTIVPTVFNTAIFPVMSRLYVQSPKSLELLFEKYFKYMALVSIPLGVGTTLLADKIILLIYGSQYFQSIIILQILIWATVFAFVYAAFVQLILSTNRIIIITKIFAVCVPENILLNLILIPKYSYIGASIALVLTELTIFILFVLAVHGIGRLFNREIFFKYVYKPVVASIVMGITIVVLNSFNLFLVILMAISIYILILILLNGIDQEDKELLKQIIRK